MPSNTKKALLAAFVVSVLVIAAVVSFVSAATSVGIHAWLATAGYLPWFAWATILHNPSSFELWGVLSGAFVIWITWMTWRSDGGGSSKAPQPTGAKGRGEFGTARWATQQEVAKTFGLFPGVPDTSGVFVGRKRRNVAFVHGGEAHVCVIGATGLGKTRRLMLPSIGVIGSVGTESMLLTDPKGELYGHSADWLRAQGYNVVRFDLRNPTRGNRWNPIAPVIQGLESGRYDKATAAAREIATTLAEEVGSEQEPFWGRASEDLMTSLILAVAQGTPPGDQGTTRWPVAAEKHMASVAAILRAAGQGGSQLDALIRRFPDDHPAYAAYGTVEQAAAETRGSIFAVTSGAMRLFSDPGVAWLTGDQDHDLSALGRRPTAVFLVIPDESSAYYGLATLYISQTLQALAALADESGGRLPVKVNFLLDEFGNLPKIKDFDKTVTVARGRGIRLTLAVQDLGQFEARYGDAAGTIKGNLGLWLYLGTGDSGTAQEVSSRLGKYTIETRDWSASRYDGGSSVTYRAEGRELLTMDEVMRWPEGRAIALMVRSHPMQIELPDLSEWEGLWPLLQVRGAEPPEAETGRVPVWTPPPVVENTVQSQEVVDLPVSGVDAIDDWAPPGPAVVVPVLSSAPAGVAGPEFDDETWQ